jgi:pyruvate formate lyase activating enzyme
LIRRFSGIPAIVRTPIIPGFNDTPPAITSILGFLRTLPRAVEYELLPYHGFGEPKYEQLGRAYRMRGLKPPSPEQMAALRKLAK